MNDYYFSMNDYCLTNDYALIKDYCLTDDYCLLMVEYLVETRLLEFYLSLMSSASCLNLSLIFYRPSFLVMVCSLTNWSISTYRSVLIASF